MGKTKAVNKESFKRRRIKSSGFAEKKDGGRDSGKSRGTKKDALSSSTVGVTASDGNQPEVEEGSNRLETSAAAIPAVEVGEQDTGTVSQLTAQREVVGMDARTGLNPPTSDTRFEMKCRSGVHLATKKHNVVPENGKSKTRVECTICGESWLEMEQKGQSRLDGWL